MLSFGWLPSVWILCADVSEHSICSILICHANKKKRRHITLRRWGITQKKEYIITLLQMTARSSLRLYDSTILASLTKYIQVCALTLLSHLLTSDFVFSASGGIIRFTLFSLTCSNAMCEMYLDLYFSNFTMKTEDAWVKKWNVALEELACTVHHGI